MRHFGVRVVAVESVPVSLADEKTIIKPREQLFARCSAKGGSVHMVPLIPEDEVPPIGARMKLCVPTVSDGKGARPILVERG